MFSFGQGEGQAGLRRRRDGEDGVGGAARRRARRGTFTPLLTDARGVVIADGEATGTIENSDPLQKDWLARFGRAAAADAIAAVTARLETPRDAGSHLTLAGQRVDLSDTDGGASLQQALTGFALLLGASPGRPGGGRLGPAGMGGPGQRGGPASPFWADAPMLEAAPSAEAPAPAELLTEPGFRLSGRRRQLAPGAHLRAHAAPQARRGRGEPNLDLQ